MIILTPLIKYNTVELSLRLCEMIQVYKKLGAFNLTDIKLSGNSKGNSNSNMAQLSVLVVLKCSFKQGMSSLA